MFSTFWIRASATLVCDRNWARAVPLSGSGGGMVTVTLSGKGDMAQVKIDSSLLKPEEAEILEDLIVAAHNDAKAKVEEAMKEKMKSLTGGLPLPPGLKLF